MAQVLDGLSMKRRLREGMVEEDRRDDGGAGVVHDLSLLKERKRLVVCYCRDVVTTLRLDVPGSTSSMRPSFMSPCTRGACRSSSPLVRGVDSIEIRK